MTTTVPATETGPVRARLDRRVLVGNLVSGAGWLLLALLLTRSLPLVLLGAGYVAAGSVFLAAAYARVALSRKQEVLAWVAPWLVAVALWAWIAAGVGGGDSGSGWLLTLWFGLCIGTPCYLAWQILALAVRQLMAWRAGEAVTPR